MNKFKINYLLLVIILCVFIMAGCTSVGRVLQGGMVTYTITPNGATGVPVNSKIGVFFSTEIDSGTINSSTFILKNGLKPVPGKVSYSGLGAVFTPGSALAPGTTYTATITKSIKDIAGNALPKDYVWSWTTSIDSGSWSFPPGRGD